METIQQKNIEKELKEAYIDYSMSVIVGRALPDVRDGFKPVHRRILYTMHNMGLVSNKATVKSARIVGECFIKDTKVLTKRGLIPIQEIKKGELVYTQDSLKKVSELYEMPEKELLKVTLENGIENIVTPSQKFKILNKNLDFEWKEAKDLTNDDFVVVKCDYPQIKEFVYLGKLEGGDIYLNSNIGYLLGQLLSGGYVEKGYNHGKEGRCGFTSSSYQIMQRLLAILKEEFNYGAVIEERDYELETTSGQVLIHKMYSIRIHKVAINRFIISAFDLANATARTKAIPEQIFQSPQSVISSLVSGLIDGDGSINTNKRAIHYGSVSTELINGFQILLQHLGILGRRYIDINLEHSGKINNKTISHNYPFNFIEISGRFAVKLANSLDLAEMAKIENLKIFKNKTGILKYDRIPYASQVLFNELSDKHIGSGWYVGKDGKKFRLGIKYPGGSKIRYSKDLKKKPLGRTQIIDWHIAEKLNRLASPYAKFVDYIIGNDLYFLNVKSVKESSPEKTYDIQVEDSHEFIANGMLSHNCMGKYHPHGDLAVYDSLGRMAQDFSLRYPLVKGQGNFGSIDGDPLASQRYTEAKLTKIAEELLLDLDKETVDLIPNYDASFEEPVVLPAKLPNLLINGSTGIAVGMATNIPPHNLIEVCDAAAYIIDKPDATSMELMQFIKGPDFPTAGMIMGSSGIKSAYLTGKGHLRLRARAHTEKKGNQENIIITEIPYQVNKSAMIEAIAEKVNEKIIEGISDIRDESDKNIRVVIELKKDANSEVVLNQLFKNSQLETTFGVNMLALHENQPKVMNLKEVLQHYIDHRVDVVTKRTKYDLRKAEERAHVLEGLKIALTNIDNIIKGIKASKNAEAATTFLMDGYKLSEIQAKAILDMKLQKLTSLEQESINVEYADLLRIIKEHNDILASQFRIFAIIKEEINELKEKYGDDRRTEIVDVYEEIETEDLIPDEDVVVIATYSGYVKRMPTETYKQQKRGGQGIIGTETKDDEDAVEHIFTSSTHSTILCFTNQGRVYWLKGWQIPEASRYAKGKAIVNLLALGQGEKINAMIPIKHFNEKHYLIMITKHGTIKKTELEAYANPRKTGIIAINLNDKDELVQVRLTPGVLKFIIGTANGMAVKFDEKDVRPVGRNAMGVRGIRLEKDDYVIGLEVALEIGDLLTVTENGFGKRTKIADYRLTRRGSKGVINIKTTDRNGKVAGIKTVMEKDEVLIISDKGVVIRVNMMDVSEIGRNTQGVTIMKLKENDKVTTLARVITQVKK